MIVAGIILAAIPAFAQLSLADAQQRAVANNVDVQIAVTTVRQREAALALARAGGIPHLTGDYFLGPQAGPFNVSTVAEHYVAVGAGISVNDLLAASSATRAAAGDLLAAQRDADAAILQARENAAKLYFAALQALAAERIRADAVSGAQRDRAAAELRARAGESPNLDVVRADVTLEQARADLVRAQADRADAVDALASATGLDPAALAALTGSTSPPGTVLLDERRAVVRALATRPELAALLATIDARTADVAGAKQSRVPTATLDGGYQKGVDSGVPVQGATVTAHIEVPLAATSGSRISAAQAQVDAARAQLVDERRTISLDVAGAVRDARADDVATQAADQARDEAGRALAAVELGYREGASSSLELAEARRTFEEAALDALVAEYQQALALAIVEVIVP
jgi:outer membrane protein, heavy metal efflux system